MADGCGRSEKRLVAGRVKSGTTDGTMFMTRMHQEEASVNVRGDGQIWNGLLLEGHQLFTQPLLSNRKSR